VHEIPVFVKLHAMSIVLDEISKSFGSRTLFSGVSAVFNPGKRYGLTGPNGAGKSTLLKIIMGEVEQTSGNITLPEKVGILRQNIEAYADYTLVETVIMGNHRLWDALQEQDRLYEGEMTDEIGMRLGELTDIIESEDGYSAEANAEELLTGAGIPTDCLQSKMKTVPTDLQFRALLCQALFGNPQALLLDEPTNHLDLDSIGWLETFLFNYSGTLIVVSHDRHFLNTVTTDIADIDYDTIITYPGNYDQMVYTKTQARSHQEAEIKSKEKKISQLKDFVAKFGAGTRASQVQSRLREIDRLQPQDLKQSNIQRPYIRFNRPEKEPGKIVCKLVQVSKSYDDLAVIKDFSYEVRKGDKVAIIGSNGRGKTTLLKIMASVLEPDSGRVEPGHQVISSYFPQEHSDIVSKKGDENVFDWLRERKAGLYDQDIRGVLGKLLFGGDDAFKKVATLSGGETARLILAGMMLEDHNFVMMDEPNNHLDLESVNALGWGIEDYKGTAVVVAHDRALVDSFANRIIAFEEDGIHKHDGPLEEYLAKREASKA
jgi:ATPase subunit of ABC transporter with duplicated ATPase domains